LDLTAQSTRLFFSHYITYFEREAFLGQSVNISQCCTSVITGFIHLNRAMKGNKLQYHNVVLQSLQDSYLTKKEPQTTAPFLHKFVIQSLVMQANISPGTTLYFSHYWFHTSNVILHDGKENTHNFVLQSLLVSYNVYCKIVYVLMALTNLYFSHYWFHTVHLFCLN
jgi:hypothetical protein